MKYLRRESPVVLQLTQLPIAVFSRRLAWQKTRRAAHRPASAEKSPRAGEREAQESPLSQGPAQAPRSLQVLAQALPTVQLPLLAAQTQSFVEQPAKRPEALQGFVEMPRQVLQAWLKGQEEQSCLSSMVSVLQAMTPPVALLRQKELLPG